MTRDALKFTQDAEHHQRARQPNRVRPQLVIQLAKAGTSKQARKRYKVTVTGAKKVQELLARAATE